MVCSASRNFIFGEEQDTVLLCRTLIASPLSSSTVKVKFDTLALRHLFPKLA